MLQYVVKFEGGTYLVLVGVFEYERSTPDIEHATPMPKSRAYAYAANWKNSEVLEVRVG